MHKAWENRGLVQNNSFWEIREGDLALFWEDRWQQEPTLLKEDFLSLKNETDIQGLSKVKDFWDHTQNPEKWRIWRNIKCDDNRPLKTKSEELKKILDQRMILVARGQDQLRWGNNKEGTFNLKEAKSILLELGSHVPDKIWQKLWKHQGWMKIKLFMWLVLQKKVLSWDNIRKRVILGPSICQLCKAQEETMEHIPNNCIYSSWLWDSFAIIFQNTNRDKENIINTLNNWSRNFSDNEFLSLAWALTPSFIIWNVWKGRNKRIFKDEKNLPQRLFEQTLKQLKETVSTTVRNQPKNPSSEMDLRILRQLGLQGLIPQSLERKVIVREEKKDFWHPPMTGFLKLNIDGASKGNPGTADFGGVLRDEEGNIISIFHGHLGRATNNMAELMALEQGLEFLKQDNRLNIIIEVDSELTINSVKRISCGAEPEKVSKH